MSEDRELQEPEALANTELIRRLEQFVSFLCGASTFEDTSFGDKNPERRGGFWWRTPLRTLEKEIITALSTPPAPEAASVVPAQEVIEEAVQMAHRYALSFAGRDRLGPAHAKEALRQFLTQHYTSPPLTAPAAPEAVGANKCPECDAPVSWRCAACAISSAPPQDAPAKAGTTPFKALDYIHNDEELEMYVQERIEAATPLKQEGAEPVEMALCESISCVLREGQLYRFVKVGDCPKCSAMSAASFEAYGAPPSPQEPAPQGDAERLEWLMHHVSGKELRRIGVHYNEGGINRAAIDAARSGAKP